MYMRTSLAPTSLPNRTGKCAQPITDGPQLHHLLPQAFATTRVQMLQETLALIKIEVAKVALWRRAIRCEQLTPLRR